MMLSDSFRYRVSLIEDISKQKKLIIGEPISVEEFDYLYDLPSSELENLLVIGNRIIEQTRLYEEI
jgi:hypothetical protein